MLPSQPREAIEVRVGRDQDAAVLEGNGGVLRIRDEGGARPRTTAEVLENLEVVDTACRRVLRCRR
jgi:hypothetical protein